MSEPDRIAKALQEIDSALKTGKFTIGELVGIKMILEAMARATDSVLDRQP